MTHKFETVPLHYVGQQTAGACFVYSCNSMLDRWDEVTRTLVESYVGGYQNCRSLCHWYCQVTQVGVASYNKFLRDSVNNWNRYRARLHKHEVRKLSKLIKQSVKLIESYTKNVKLKRRIISEKHNINQIILEKLKINLNPNIDEINASMLLTVFAYFHRHAPRRLSIIALYYCFSIVVIRMDSCL